MLAFDGAQPTLLILDDLMQEAGKRPPHFKFVHKRQTSQRNVCYHVGAEYVPSGEMYANNQFNYSQRIIFNILRGI